MTREGNYSRPHHNTPRATVEAPGDWVERAACRGVNPEIFFYERPGRGDTFGPARQVCAGCTVTTTCLEYALRTELPSARYGVWGGLTPLERHALVRERSAS